MKRGILVVLSTVAGAAIGAVIDGKESLKKKREIEDLSNKHLDLFLLMNQWVRLKQQGKSPVIYFERENYKNIAIYGMSYVGKTLVEELRESNIKVKYAIDKRAGSIYSDIEIISPDDRCENVDAIIVTSIRSYGEIEKKLGTKVNCPIISLETILYDL